MGKLYSEADDFIKIPTEYSEYYNSIAYFEYAINNQ